MRSIFHNPEISLRCFYRAVDRQSAIEEAGRYKRFLAEYGKVEVRETVTIRKDKAPMFRYVFAASLVSISTPEATFSRLMEKLGTGWHKVNEDCQILDIRFTNAGFAFSNLKWACIEMFDQSDTIVE